STLSLHDALPISRLAGYGFRSVVGVRFLSAFLFCPQTRRKRLQTGHITNVRQMVVWRPDRKTPKGKAGCWALIACNLIRLRLRRRAVVKFSGGGRRGRWPLVRFGPCSALC